MCGSGLLEMNRDSVKNTKSQKNQIQKSKFAHAVSVLCEYFYKSIRSGCDFVRINTEFPIKNHPIESSFKATKHINCLCPRVQYPQNPYSPLAPLAALRGSIAPAFGRRSGPALLVSPPLLEGNLKSTRQPARQNLPSHRIRHAVATCSPA